MSSTIVHSSRKSLRWLPGLIISAIAIYAVFRFTRGQDFVAALRNVNPLFILFLIGASILTLLARAVAWRTILGKKISLSTSFFGVSEGYFLNNLFPLRAGEIGRALLVGRSSGLGTLHVLSTILIERAFDIIFAASVILLTLPFVVGADWVKPVAFTAFIVVIAGLVVLLFISIKRDKFQDWLQRRHFRSRLITNKVLPQINKIMDGLSALVHPQQFMLSFFWIGVNWLFWLVMYYFTIAQIAPQAQLWWGGFIAGLLSLGVAIPAAPASVGVYEASVMGAFAVLGVSSSSGLAYAIVLHLVQLLVTTTFGLWGMIRDGQRFSTLLASIGNQNKANEILKEEEY